MYVSVFLNAIICVVEKYTNKSSSVLKAKLTLVTFRINRNGQDKKFGVIFFPRFKESVGLPTSKNKGVRHNNLGVSDSWTPFSVKPCFWTFPAESV